MLQLIYTSAPRLLEAGKTGFGTVARSRQLPQSLITYLERISTYDRSAGVEALQCYSVFRMGLMVYHIFTRIGDCGVDYTKRTNHIAHHFIVQDDVVCEGPLAAVSPAAFMMSLQHKWKTQWTGNPAWIDEESEGVPAVPPAGAYWQRLTGHADNAQWLSTQTCAEGANILLPAGCGLTECLGLMHEAAMQRSDKGWGMGFSTAAVSTLSSKVCPCVCLGEEQIRAGVRPRAGFPTLQVGPQLAPPTAADFPPVVQVSTPQATMPVAPMAQESPLPPGMVPPAAPPAMAPGYPTPVPAPVVSSAMPQAAPVYPTATLQEDTQSPLQKYGWGIAACVLLIGVVAFALPFESETPKPQPIVPTNPPEGGYTFAPDDEPREGKKDEAAPKEEPQQEQKDEPAPKEEPRQEQKNEPAPAPEQPKAEPQPQPIPAPQPPAAETEKTYQCKLKSEEVSLQVEDMDTLQVKINFSISARNLRNAAADLGSIIRICGEELREGEPYVHHHKFSQKISPELQKKALDERKAREKFEEIRHAYEEAPRGKKPEKKYRNNRDELYKALHACKDPKKRKELEQHVNWINKENLQSDGKAAKAALNKAQKAKEEAFAAEKKKYENQVWMLRFTYEKDGAIYNVHIVDIIES